MLALLLALIAVVALSPSLGNAQKPVKKLAKQDILDLLVGDVSSDDVAQLAQKSGISFQVTASVEKDIRGAGGTDNLIRVLKSLAPSAPVSPPSSPRTSPSASPPVLMIEANPGESQVYIDDEPMGSTSQQGRLKLTRLAAGDHQVRIALSGYQDYEQTITLTGGQTTTVAATLQRPAAPLQPERTQAEPTPPANTGQPAYLGVQALPKQPPGAHGVVIGGTTPGSPAEQAGLKQYDTILSVNGQQVNSLPDVRNALTGRQVGDVVQVTWYNGSTNVTRPIRLIPGSALAQPAAQPAQSPTLTNMPHTGVVSFRVAHDHGRSGQDYCVGVMSVGNGMIHYQADNGVHVFDIPLNSIKEARRNTVYLVGYGAFHIHTKRGSNFNFAAINAQNQPQPPDAVLNAIDTAMGN
jgi:hypothetical protein